MRRFTTFLFMTVLTLVIARADFICTGRIIDAADSQPLIGAVVSVVDSESKNTVTVTDIDGCFSFKIPDNSIVRILYIGYESLTLKAHPSMGTIGLSFEKPVVPSDEQLAAWKSEAAELYEKKQYEEAYEIYERLSGLGELQSRYMMAYLLYVGYGVEQDKKEAVFLFKSAAEGGQKNAQYIIGLLYNSGDDFVEKDPVLAKKWLKKAADQGHKDANALLYDLMQEK